MWATSEWCLLLCVPLGILAGVAFGSLRNKVSPIGAADPGDTRALG